MFDLLTGGASTIISSLLGSVSGVVGHYFKAKEKKEKQKHELDLARLNMARDKQESELMLAEIAANLKVEEFKTEGALLLEESKDFNSAISSITKSKTLGSKAFEKLLDGNWFQRLLGTVLAFLMGLVDITRRLVRPALTFGSAAAIAYLIRTLTVDITDFDDEQQLLLLTLVIDATVYVLTASVQFWFMDRAGARDFRKKH